MKITKIKKIGSGKYNLILDNNEKIVTYDNVILNNDLLFKKEIDNNLYQKLNQDTNYYNIYNKCVKLIGIRLRSEKEINEHLEKNNVTDILKEKIVSELKTQNLINDEKFAKAFILDKINFNNYGPLKIKKLLAEHNIEENIINSELSKIDSEIYYEKIKKFVDKKVSTNRKYSNYMLKQKIMTDLINLGFSKEDINSCLNEIETNDNNLIEKNFEKIYNKLSIKYSGNELKYKIKEKLYQKGFSISEIDNIINKKIG